MKNASTQQYPPTKTPYEQIHTANTDLLPPVAQLLVSHYATLSCVRLIMTIGSIASGQSDKHSDVDLIVICDDNSIPSKRDRFNVIEQLPDTATINALDAHMWVFGTSDDFTVEGQEICTQFFTKSSMRQKNNRIIHGFYEQVGIQHPLASLSGILNATVHIDKDAHYDEIHRQIDPYPQTLQMTILDRELNVHLPYYLGRLQTAIDRGDMPFARKLIQQVIDSIVHITFAQHKCFPNGPKRLFQQIREITDRKTAERIIDGVSALYTSDLTLNTASSQYAVARDLYLFLQTQ